MKKFVISKFINHLFDPYCIIQRSKLSYITNIVPNSNSLLIGFATILSPISPKLPVNLTFLCYSPLNVDVHA